MVPYRQRVQAYVSKSVDSLFRTIQFSNGVVRSMDKIVLSDLKDVSDTAPGDGNVLQWSAAQGKWIPGTGGGSGSGVTSVSTTDSFVTITNPTTTPSISIGEASGTATGVLSSTDWNTFNNKTAFAEPAIFSGGGTPTLASGVTGLEIRTLIGAGIGDGVVTSLTTSGTSGAATLNAGVLNIPNYTTSGGSGTVTEVTTSAPLTVTNGTTTPALDITQSNTNTDGYLSSIDWNTFNNKQDALTFGIADGNAVDIDAGASIVANDYAKFTATGLIGQTYAEVKTDLSLNNVENTAISTWAGSSNITTVGTISSGTWNGSTIGIANGGTGQTTAQAAIDALTQVSGATNEYVLTKDTATGNAVWKAASGGGGGSGNATETIDYYQISNISDSKPFHTDTYIKLGWDESGNDLELTMVTAPSSGGIYSLVTKSDNSGSTQTFISTTNLATDIFPAGIGAGYRGTVTITAEDDVNYPFYQVEVYNPSESAKISICVRAIQK